MALFVPLAGERSDALLGECRAVSWMAACSSVSAKCIGSQVQRARRSTFDLYRIIAAWLANLIGRGKVYFRTLAVTGPALAARSVRADPLTWVRYLSMWSTVSKEDPAAFKTGCRGGNRLGGSREIPAIRAQPSPAKKRLTAPHGPVELARAVHNIFFAHPST